MQDSLLEAVPSLIKDKDLLASRRSSLVRAATEIFMQRGFGNASVNEVAEAAGMSIGALYKYVRTKEDILWLVMDSIYGQLENELLETRAGASSPVEAFVLTLECYLRAVDRIRRGILLMYREYRNLPRDAQKEFMARERDIVQIFMDIIRDGNKQGYFHCPNPETAALDVLMMGHTWSLKSWMFKNIPIDEYIRRQIELTLALVGASRTSSNDGSRITDYR